MVVRQSDLYSTQFEHAGLSMSHLIFLVKHKSHAKSVLVDPLVGSREVGVGQVSD